MLHVSDSRERRGKLVLGEMTVLLDGVIHNQTCLFLHGDSPVCGSTLRNRRSQLISDWAVEFNRGVFNSHP